LREEPLPKTRTLSKLFLAGLIFAGSNVIVLSTGFRPVLVRILGKPPFLAL